MREDWCGLSSCQTPADFTSRFLGLESHGRCTIPGCPKQESRDYIREKAGITSTPFSQSAYGVIEKRVEATAEAIFRCKERLQSSSGAAEVGTDNSGHQGQHGGLDEKYM